MKRLFLLIAVCMIGMVLPQGMWAETYTANGVTIVVEGKTVTINSTNAGALSTYLNSGNASDAIAAIQAANGDGSSIVFNDKFNADDLNALRDKSCCVQETVNMLNAQFVNGNNEPNYSVMSFQNWGSNVTTAITSQHVDSDASLPNNMFNSCSRLTDLTISSGKIVQVCNDENNKPPLKNVTIGNKVSQIGDQWANDGFAKFSTIEKVEFEGGGTVPLEFRANCFINCTSLKKITIPARSTLVGKQAFGYTGLEEVIFESPKPNETAAPLIIKSEAFEGSTSIIDVYVNVDPNLKPLVCEYNAFNFNTLDAQSDITKYNSMATLHFDDKAFDTEYYKGTWKEGVGLTHDELMAIRGQNVQTSLVNELQITSVNSSLLVNNNNTDQVDYDDTPVTYDSGSNNGYTMGYVQSRRPANGWQQFAKTGNEIPVTGKFIRSYSRYNPAQIPTYGTSTTPIVKIYRIWKFDDGYTDGADITAENTIEKKAYAKEVTGYIPGNTGLIMVGITNQNVLYNFKAYTGTTRQYPFTDNTKLETANEAEDNLLEGNPNSDIELNPTLKDGGQITHRIFGFKASEKKFLRARPGTKLTKNHAFLKLNTDLFHWRNEKGGTNSEGIADPGQNNSKISFIYFLDEEEEFGGIATVIRKAIEEADMEDGEFYTLQGVKVNKPTTKGVYIHNGKKVLVK